MSTRRPFLQAAALLTATASQSSGRVNTTAPNVAVNEIDIGDPANTDIQCQIPEDAYVQLFELNPPDPGMLSGARLHILNRGRETGVIVDIGTQFLGFVEYAGIMRFFAAVEERVEWAETGMELIEKLPALMGGPETELYGNGGWITLIPDQHELRLTFSRHCFGFLKGRLADKFIRCLRHRLAEGVGAA